jgi:hypothetical protein
MTNEKPGVPMAIYQVANVSEKLIWGHWHREISRKALTVQ